MVIVFAVLGSKNDCVVTNAHTTTGSMARLERPLFLLALG